MSNKEPQKDEYGLQRSGQ